MIYKRNIIFFKNWDKLLTNPKIKNLKILRGTGYDSALWSWSIFCFFLTLWNNFCFCFNWTISVFVPSFLCYDNPDICDTDTLEPWNYPWHSLLSADSSSSSWQKLGSTCSTIRTLNFSSSKEPFDPKVNFSFSFISVPLVL